MWTQKYEILSRVGKGAERQRIDAFELWCCEDSWESLGLQGDPTRPFWRRSALNIHWKDWRWSWNSNTLATWCEELTYLKRPWCWQRLKARGEGDDRGWDGWMASPIRWTWVWVNSGSWWWTGRPGMLQSKGLQKGQTQLSHWTELSCVHAKSLQLCLTYCDPMNCSLTGSCVCGILQARMLDSVAMPYSRGSSRPRGQIRIFMSPTLAGRFFTSRTTWKAPVYFILLCNSVFLWKL